MSNESTTTDKTVAITIIKTEDLKNYRLEVDLNRNLKIAPTDKAHGFTGEGQPTILKGKFQCGLDTALNDALKPRVVALQNNKREECKTEWKKDKTNDKAWRALILKEYEVVITDTVAKTKVDVDKLSSAKHANDDIEGKKAHIYNTAIGMGLTEEVAKAMSEATKE